LLGLVCYDLKDFYAKAADNRRTGSEVIADAPEPFTTNSGAAVTGRPSDPRPEAKFVDDLPNIGGAENNSLATSMTNEQTLAMRLSRPVPA